MSKVNRAEVVKAPFLIDVFFYNNKQASNFFFLQKLSYTINACVSGMYVYHTSFL